MFYSWKGKFGVMTAADVKRLQALKDENAKLKKLLAEQMLNAAATKELLAKNSGTRRQAQGCCASVGQVRSVVAVACRIARGGSQDAALPVALHAIYGATAALIPV